MHSLPSSISKADINELPIVKFEGDVVIINSDDQLKAMMEALKHEEVLGFDTEHRPVFKAGQEAQLSLLQLASEEQAYLIQLNKIEHVELLRPLLESAKVLKVGLALHDDIKKLRRLLDFSENGFVEISKLTKQLGITNTGLRSLVAIFLKKRISKSAQLSNWSKSDLTPAQVSYAATDAWMSRELYLRVMDWKE